MKKFTLVIIISVCGFTQLYAQTDSEVEAVPNLLIKSSVTPKNLYVYPNPAKDMLLVNNTSGKKILNASVVDLYGRLIITESGNNNRIDISQLQKGIYVAELKIEEIYYQYKFIKD